MSGLDKAFSKQRAAAQRGVSIIELMVSIVISLLIAMAALSSANVFGGMQRQSMSTGGAAVNTSSALAALKNDLASAGLGFFGDGQFLCNRLNLGVANQLHFNNAAFSPVRITSATAADQIDVLYGSQVAAGSNVVLDVPTTGATADVRSLLPVTESQTVLLAPESPGDACLVRTVTAVTPSTNDAKQVLTFGTSGRHNAGAFSATPQYSNKGRITMLGELQWSRYRMVGTDLTLERPMDGTSAVLARNVIGFRAQYGVADAAAGSTTLESWEPAAGTTFGSLNAAGLPRVRAIRVGLVARSLQREKVNAKGVCEASTEKPKLFGEVVEPDVADWECFRYRTAVVVVPLRNLVMGLTPS